MKPKKFHFLLLLLPVLFAGTKTSLAQNPEKDAIIERVLEYEIAYNQGDTKAAAAIYATSGYHTNASGITHVGRTEIEKDLAESFEGPMKGTQIKLNSEDIQFAAPDLAYERESFFLSGVKMPDGSTMPTIKGYCLGIYQKLDGVWYVLGMQCMVPLAPPQ